MEKYIVAQLECTSKHTCMLDGDFFAFQWLLLLPVQCFGSPILTAPKRGPSLPAVNDVCTTYVPWRAQRQWRLKLEFKSFTPVEDNPAISSYLVFWAAISPRRHESLSHLCLAHWQPFSCSSAREHNRPPPGITASFLTRKAKLLYESEKLDILVRPSFNWKLL